VAAPPKAAAPKVAPRTRPSRRNAGTTRRRAGPRPGSRSAAPGVSGAADRPLPVQNAPAIPAGIAGPAEAETLNPPTLDDEEEAGADETADGEGSEAAWNTRGLPDGRYRVKVIVSDGRANPAEPLSAEKLSDWFLLDNTAPTVRRSAIQRDARGLPLRIPCSDALSYLSGADYRIDGGEWIGAASEDGIWDSTAETALVDAKKLPAGRHTVEFRIRDAAGNSRVEKLSYTLAAAPK
jgi:hypothetical protein